MTETLVQIHHPANDAVLGYLEFRARLSIPNSADPTAHRRQRAGELLIALAQHLAPDATDMRLHGHPVLAAPNGVIFAMAGSNGLLKFRMARPFPEVELSVGLMPAQHIGLDWCYCDPRAEPDANLELWLTMAYDFALQAPDGL